MTILSSGKGLWKFSFQFQEYQSQLAYLQGRQQFSVMSGCQACWMLSSQVGEEDIEAVIYCSMRFWTGKERCIGISDYPKHILHPHDGWLRVIREYLILLLAPLGMVDPINPSLRLDGDTAVLCRIDDAMVL